MLNRALILIILATMWQSTLSYSQKISIDSIKTCVGEHAISVSINATDLNNIGAITLYIAFDSTILKFDTIENINSTLPGTIANKIPNKPEIGIVWSATSSGADLGSGKFCDLRFVIKKSGLSALPFDAGCEIADFSANVLNVIYQKGSINVNPLPIVSFTGLMDTYCLSALTDTLTGTPAGGTFLGEGISGNTFNATLAGSGTHQITYSYTDQNGCSGYQAKTITVSNLLAVSFSGLNQQYCVNAGTVELIGVPAGGTFSGNGISGNSFNAGLAGIGIHQITYSYTDQNGCSGYQVQTVTVNDLPAVSFSGLNTQYCINANTVELIGTPAGGQFNGVGMNDNIFNPSIAGAGVHAITYMYTNNQGCSNSVTESTTINELPAVSIEGLLGNYCIYDLSDTLTGTPAGGQFSGTGMNGNIFNPSIVGVGVYTITYTYTDNNGCSNTATATATVNRGSIITANPVSATICNGNSVELTAQGSSAYLWSTGETNSSITVSPTLTTTYIVTGTDMVAGCQSNTVAITVNVNPLPIVTVNVSATTVTGVNTAWTIKNSGLTFNPSNITINNGDSVKFQLGGIHNAVEVSQATWNANGNTPLPGGFSTPFGGGLVLPANLTAGVHYYVCAPHASLGMKGIITVAVSSPAICAGSSITLSGGGANTYTWSDGVIDGIGFIPTFTNTYTVTGTDANGCTNTQSVKITVIQNPVVIINPIDPAICSGGSATLTVSGASSYMWSTGETTSSILVSPTSTSTYTVTGANVSGCTTTQSVQVVVNQNPVVIINPANPTICNGSSVELTAQGGSTYMWGTGETTSSITVSPTSTTTYTVMGTNASGCATTQSVQVVVNQNLIVAISPANPTICNGSSVKLSAQGASTYVWSTGETTSSITVSPTSTTTYTVTGTLGNCTDTQSAQVVVNQNPVVVINPVNPAICNGGSVELTAQGASTYMWSTGETTSSITVSPTFTTTYTVMGTNASGCATTQSVQVVVNQNLIVAINPINPTICNGSSVELAAQGASTYVWTTGETTSSITVSPTSTTTYTVTGTLGNCAATQSAQVIVNQNPVITINPVNPEICNGSSVELTAQGASTYLWNTGETTSSITVSPTSTVAYTVTGTLGNCTATQSAQVVVNQNPIITINPADPTICNGGSVELTAQGTSTYMWSTGETTSSITVSPTSTTTYTVMGTNASGCATTQSVQVVVNQNLIVAINPINPEICNGSSVELTAQGASTYLWNTGETTSSITVSPTSTAAYTVTGTLGNCAATQSAQVIVNQNPVITINPADPTICNGSSVELTAEGASTYVWSTGETTSSITVSPTSTAAYTVMGTNASGCATTQSVQVVVNQNPIVAINPVDPEICNGSSVILTALGGSSYMWSTGETTSSITVAPTSTTTYTVMGTNANGCTTTQLVQVVVNQNLNIAINPIDPTVCSGSSVILTANGASGYVWSTGESTSSITVSPTSTTIYTVTGTLGNCTATQSAQVIVNQNPAIIINPANPTICNGSSVELTAQGASTYVWSTGETTSSITVSPTSATGYTVTGSNTGCQNTASTAVTVNPLPAVTANVSGATVSGINTTWTIKNSGLTFNPSNITINNGDSVKFQLGSIHNVVEVSQATWNANGNTPLPGGFSTPFGGGLVLPANLTAGVHYYVCAPHASLGMKGIITVAVSSPAICVGSSITLSGGGANTYTWSDGVIDGIGFIPTSTNTYTVTGTDENGCTNTQSVKITVIQNPVITINPIDPTICSGSSVMLTAGGVSGYVWSTGETTSSITVSPTSTTTYTVTGANASGCTNTQSVQVIVNQNLIVAINPLNPTICNGSSVELTAQGASTYVWSTGETTSSIIIFPTSTTTYTVTGTLGNCTAIQSAQVIVNQNPVVVINPANPTICNGSSVELTAQGTSTYMWITGETTSSITISPTSTTTYTVMGTNASGCVTTQSAQVVVNQSPVIIINPVNPAICKGGSVELTAQGASTYVWSTGETTSSITVSPTSTTTYAVIGTNPSGCATTQMSIVTVNPTPTITISPLNPVICNGSSLELTALDGSTLLWSTGETASSILVSPTSTTTYTVTAINTIAGCQPSLTPITVTVNPLPIVTANVFATTITGGNTIWTIKNSGLTFNPSNITINNGDSVKFQLSNSHNAVEVSQATWNANGMTPLSGGFSTPFGGGLVLPGNLTVGVHYYVCTPHASLGMKGIITVTASSPAVCAGSSITLSGGGANTYVWSGGVSDGVGFMPTSTDTYTVTGTDANGCTNTQSVKIRVIQTPDIIISPVNPTICIGSSIVLTASGASGYVWSTGETASSITVSPILTTTYTVTGANANGCTTTQMSIVTVAPKPAITLSPVDPTICSGSSIVVTAQGASTYVWSTGETTSSILVFPTSTTTYTVTGTLDNCTSTESAQVVVNQTPVITINHVISTICNGSSVELTAQGGSTYMWSTGETASSIIVSPTSTTTYTVTGTLGNCTSTQSAQVIVNQNPIITINPVNPTICNGSSVELTAQGASAYMWSTGETTSSIIVSPTSTTTYTVIGTLGNCIATQSAQVVVNQNPIITINPVNPTICSGSSVELIAQGGSTYAWSTGATTSSIIVSPTSTITYTVIGANASGCTITQVSIVTVNPQPALTIAPTNPAICSGTSVTLTANGATTYVWNTGASTAYITVTPGTATAYTVTGTNGIGCKSSQSTIVTVNTTPAITISPINPSICNGSPVKLTASGAGNNGSYKWSTGAITASITVSPNATTIYTVTGTNLNGCTNVQTTVVTVNPTIVITPAGTTICNGSSVILTATGVGNGGSYKWSTGAKTNSIVVSPATSTAYTVTGTNTNGCKNSQSAMVTVNPKPIISITPVNPSLCNGGSVTLTANGASAYGWSTGATTKSIVVSPGSTTSYLVTGTNSNGCTNTRSTVVTVNPNPVISITPDNPSICNGSPVKLTANGAGYNGSYQWSTGSTTKSILVSPASTTTYSVMGTNSNGCTNSQSTVVTLTPSIVINPISATLCRGKSIVLTANGAGNGGSYNWNTGARTRSILVSPYSTTTYTVTGTNTDGCKNSATSAITVINCRAEQEVADTSEQYFYINPNPATEYITLGLHVFKNSYGKIEILGMLGNKVKEVKQGILTNEEIEINIKDLPAGVYYVKIMLENDMLIKKLIVN